MLSSGLSKCEWRHQLRLVVRKSCQRKTHRRRMSAMMSENASGSIGESIAMLFGARGQFKRQCGGDMVEREFGCDGTCEERKNGGRSSGWFIRRPLCAFSKPMTSSCSCFHPSAFILASTPPNTVPNKALWHGSTGRVLPVPCKAHKDDPSSIALLRWDFRRIITPSCAVRSESRDDNQLQGALND